MKWIRSALASDTIEDVWFLEGTVKDGDGFENGTFGSGIWLRVNKFRFIIIDTSPEIHVVLAR